jgi:alkylated DNA repair dioxygenase AlkB
MGFSLGVNGTDTMQAAFPQMSLFGDESKMAIPGLRYLPDYIDAAGEAALIQTIDSQPWLADLKRRVQHYGYKYDYKARSITRDLRLGPIPGWLGDLCERLQAERVFSKRPDQVIINEYLPGQGITPHIDCVPCFGETIASISVGTPCVMEFTQPEAKLKDPVLLEPRSLVVLEGDARYKWQHAIPQRKTDNWNGQKLIRGRRISLTFRTVILEE